MNFQFPQISNEPVPFYKHPYKLFASTPVTLLTWRSVQIASYKGLFGPNDAESLMWVNASLFCTTFFHNLACLALCSYHEIPCPSLKESVTTLVSMHGVNMFDAVAPIVLDYELGKNAPIVRIVIIAATVLLSLELIRRANRDEPYQTKLRMRAHDNEINLLYAEEGLLNNEERL